MFSISSVKGKFKRSQIDFKKTFLWENTVVEVKEEIEKLLDFNEVPIIYFNKSNDYNWCLTNKRLIFPIEGSLILLSELTNVDFVNIKNNPNSKTENKELTLTANKKDFKIFFEENSWHLFYSIFKFIILNNKNNAQA